MDSFDFPQPLNLELQGLDFLHKLEVIGSAMDRDPFKMLWHLEALVKLQI